MLSDSLEQQHEMLKRFKLFDQETLKSYFETLIELDFFNEQITSQGNKSIANRLLPNKWKTV